MERWQALRLQRAKHQDLHCVGIEFSNDSAIFWIIGLSDQYEVEIHQDADLWPPTCTCEDHAWRPHVHCKHIIFCLAQMGVDDEYLADCEWEPVQEEIYEILTYAPNVVREGGRADDSMQEIQFQLK